MELDTEQTTRPCACGEYTLPVSVEGAARIDAGKSNLLCNPNCWGVYLMRRGDNEKGTE
jgi:hypothetical protein